MDEIPHPHPEERYASSDIPLDTVFRLLANSRTRATLSFLRSQPETTVDELAAVVSGLEAATDDRIATPRAYDDVRITLYHSTLPRLGDHGFIEFDADTTQVTVSKIPEEVTALLAVSESYGQPS